MNPYITEFLGLNILAALHRIAPAAVTGMNTLPNAGGMVAQLNWMKISLKDGYPYVFVTSVVAPMIGAFVACLVAMVMY